MVTIRFRFLLCARLESEGSRYGASRPLTGPGPSRSSVCDHFVSVTVLLDAAAGRVLVPDHHRNHTFFATTSSSAPPTEFFSYFFWAARTGLREGCFLYRAGGPSCLLVRPAFRSGPLAFPRVWRRVFPRSEKGSGLLSLGLCGGTP